MMILFRLLFPTLYAITRVYRIYRIRHERLLGEHERLLYEAVQSAAHSVSAWTHDDIVQLASLTVTRKLEAARKHVRAVKAARAARGVARYTQRKETKP